MCFASQQRLAFFRSIEVLNRVERGLAVDLDAETYLVKLPPWLAERVRASASGTEIGRSDPINAEGKCRFAATGCALQGKPSDFEIVIRAGSTMEWYIKTIFRTKPAGLAL